MPHIARAHSSMCAEFPRRRARHRPLLIRAVLTWCRLRHDSLLVVLVDPSIMCHTPSRVSRLHMFLVVVVFTRTRFHLCFFHVRIKGQSFTHGLPRAIEGSTDHMTGGIGPWPD